MLGGSGIVIEVAAAEAGGVVTLETENAAVVGKTGAITGGVGGSDEPPELLLPQAASSNDAQIETP